MRYLRLSRAPAASSYLPPHISCLHLGPSVQTSVLSVFHSFPSFPSFPSFHSFPSFLHSFLHNCFQVAAVIRFLIGVLFIFVYFSAGFGFFWVPGSMLSCFSAFLLFCFSAFLLFAFPASLPFLLFCFSAFLLFAFLLLCFSASLFSLLLCSSAFVLLCLSTFTTLFFLFFSHVFLLLYFLPASLLSVFAVSLFCFILSCLYPT